MKEENKNIDYHELCSKYLSGNATPIEVQQLEAWVLESKKNKEEFLALRQAWLKTNTKVVTKAINLDAEWELIEKQLGQQTKVVDLKPKSNGLLLKIAAAVAVLVAASLWLFRPTDTGDNLIVFSESEVKEQALTDGSQIALNQFSTASYSRDQQDKIQVIVNSGTVAMEIGSQKVILTKGEVGTYVKSSQQLSEQTNDDPNFLAWKTKRLVYDNTPLEKVVYDLNRTFHAQVSLANSELNNCPITATYQNKPLEVKATTNGQQTVISGTCN